MNLDNVKEITKVDRENMLELLTTFPRQCEDALFIGKHVKINPSYKGNYANIVFTGLGGSAIGADIISGYVGDEIDIPVFVNRNYTLPHFVNKKTLLFAVSYSGNTEETLSAYEKAKKKGAKVVVITSGGKLEELAAKAKDMLITIPKGYPPRCALGYSFIPSVMVLVKLGFIKDKSNEIKKAARFLDNLQKKKLIPGVRTKVNMAKSIAGKLYGKFPVIYASARMEALATRWRGQFAENAKTLSSSHVFPEMNHNEIVGWKSPAGLLEDFVAIILRDKGDHARIKKRMDITTVILRKAKLRVLEVESEGRTPLARMLSLTFIADFVSVYLAVLNGTNPTPVDRITYLKKQLAK